MPDRTPEEVDTICQRLVTHMKETFGSDRRRIEHALDVLSRAEDLQTIALPLSIPAIAGYFPAVLALSGGAGPFIRFASYVPLWSPFVMLARLATGNVAPWELALSLGLLVLTVPLVTLLAIRVYRAGVLLYGQPPTARTFMRALRG